MRSVDKYDPNGIITILDRSLTKRVGTKLHEGYTALLKLEGREYKDFRALAGSKPKRPLKDDRPFSPSDTMRDAIKIGFAKLVSRGAPEIRSRRREKPDRSYPISSHSWTVYSPTVAKKQLDRSAFLHRGTGVPKEIVFYFNFESTSVHKHVSLIHGGTRYQGSLSVENQRVRLFWDAPFAKCIKQTMPERYQQFKSDDGGIVAPAEIHFSKESHDAYLVDFRDPETTNADVDWNVPPPSPTAYEVTRSNQLAGFVYVIGLPAYPGIFKIGHANDLSDVS